MQMFCFVSLGLGSSGVKVIRPRISSVTPQWTNALRVAMRESLHFFTFSSICLPPLAENPSGQALQLTTHLKLLDSLATTGARARQNDQGMDGPSGRTRMLWMECRGALPIPAFSPSWSRNETECSVRFSTTMTSELSRFCNGRNSAPRPHDIRALVCRHDSSLQWSSSRPADSRETPTT